MKQSKQIINYPSGKMFKHAELPNISADIIKDRGNKFTYKLILAPSVITISCKLPNGIILTGMSFVNPKEDDHNVDIGLQVASGRLEGSLRSLNAIFDDGRMSFGKQTFNDGTETQLYSHRY